MNVKTKGFEIFLMLLLSTIMITASMEVLASDIQPLIECHRLMCDDGSNETKIRYFEAFPNTFTDFQSVFGYEETPDGVLFGELYTDALDYIIAFFQLNTDIRPDIFADKIIRLCINGKWQADGVNILQINVVNIVTVDTDHHCFYEYLDIIKCYDETLKHALLSQLSQYNEKEVSSFWRFYFDGIQSQSIYDSLFLRTKACIQGYPTLTKMLEKINIAQNIDCLEDVRWSFKYDGLCFDILPENGSVQREDGSLVDKVELVSESDGPFDVCPNYEGLDTCIIPPFVYWREQWFQVVGIGEFAFLYCGNLQYVEIPNTISYIRHGAFSECYMLENVYIPTNVDTVGAYVFGCCPSLKAVYFPKSTKVDNKVFSGFCYRSDNDKTTASIIKYKGNGKSIQKKQKKK